MTPSFSRTKRSSVSLRSTELELFSINRQLVSQRQNRREAMPRIYDKIQSPAQSLALVWLMQLVSQRYARRPLSWCIQCPPTHPRHPTHPDRPSHTKKPLTVWMTSAISTNRSTTQAWITKTNTEIEEKKIEKKASTHLCLTVYHLGERERERERERGGGRIL